MPITNMTNGLFNEDENTMSKEEIKERLKTSINEAKAEDWYNVGLAIRSKISKDTLNALEAIHQAIMVTYLKLKGSPTKTMCETKTLAALIKINIEDYLSKSNLKVEYRIMIITPKGNVIPFDF